MYKDVGVSSKTLDRVADFHEQNGQLTEELSDEDLKTLAVSAKPLLIMAKSESDSKLEEFKKKNNSNEKPKEENTSADTSKIDQPDLAKLIADALKPLTDKIEGLEKEKTKQTLNEKLIARLEEKKIPKSYYTTVIDGRELTDDSNVEDLLTKVESGYTSLKKEFGQESLGLAGGTITGGTDVSKAALKSSIESWAKQKQPEAAK